MRNAFLHCAIKAELGNEAIMVTLTPLYEYNHLHKRGLGKTMRIEWGIHAVPV